MPDSKKISDQLLDIYFIILILHLKSNTSCVITYFFKHKENNKSFKRTLIALIK